MTNPLRFRIRLNSRQWLGVVIWDTHRGYLAGTQHHYQGMRNKHSKRIASYLHLHKARGAFGRAYFSAEKIGAATVAHELMHFVFSWMQEKHKGLSDGQDEPIAELMDRCTNVFWGHYFKRWPDD